MLHEFLTANTAEIIARTRFKIAARTSPVPTEAELKNGVPLFLTQLIDRLRLATTNSDAIEQSAGHHGGELAAMGFSVSQVVHGYGDICQAITQLAEETNAPITVEEFNTFNRCQDDATAEAVSEYERYRDRSAAYNGMERQGALAHEMGNRVAAALIAFKILKTGAVGIGGSTGAVLGRSLRALRSLINNSLAEVRLESGHTVVTRVPLADLMAEVELEASMRVGGPGQRLVVSEVDPGVEVQADAQILSAALSNLLHNAFKFGGADGQVSLITKVTADRVLFEVEDECGGLPPGKIDQLFKPFRQQDADRSGLGLGLTISRRGVEAMGGRLSVRDMPGHGCVFSIDLPRAPVA
ncbi:MAG: HAMP domain-containing histidine kinase [Vicinamibacteria bacterium]|nr:HAMP domain-containing histidine kinase [Vicinamibacteria bacterium]